MVSRFPEKDLVTKVRRVKGSGVLYSGVTTGGVTVEAAGGGSWITTLH